MNKVKMMDIKCIECSLCKLIDNKKVESMNYE